jgi:DNA mismatch repair protein MutL
MENSIDAGATEVTLVLKEAGKVLIQVSDNGKGMSSTDARMCFERHATSKIKTANDIFQIKTKGFRGEALSSIVAISHVELVTKQVDDEVGTKVVLIGSKFKKQEQSQSDNGTKISVKNLFFNVPARRKFLKSDSVELKHINDEFIRLALAHTDVMFSLFHNGKELYRLSKSNLLLVKLFGIWIYLSYKVLLLSVISTNSIFRVTFDIFCSALKSLL